MFGSDGHEIVLLGHMEKLLYKTTVSGLREVAVLLYTYKHRETGEINRQKNMFREQGKVPEKDHNEKEISKLPDKRVPSNGHKGAQ